MNKEIISFGHVNSEGELSIYEKNSFIKSLKDIFTSSSVEICIRERNYKFSDGQRAYYFAVIVPQVRKAFMVSGVLKSLKEVDSELRSMFLYYEELDEYSGEYEKHLHSLGNLNTKVSKSMMKDFCEKCIIWCITNLDWAIPFPNEVFTTKEMTERQKQTENPSLIGTKTF